MQLYADQAKNSYPIAFGAQDNRVDIAKSKISSDNVKTIDSSPKLLKQMREEVSSEMLTEFETQIR
jgi:hypothetical protein